MGLLESLGLYIPIEKVTGSIVRKEDGYVKRLWHKIPVTVYVIRPDEGVWVTGYDYSNLGSEGDRVEMSFVDRIENVRHENSSENAYQISSLRKVA
ncbi:MAG: hypothetical protein HYW24_05380 [Candidatus Aenigmarchaeota archaeon]|nr:hypothetical protein [Candidatus Aenigmarchaeota archaeon]